MTQRKVRSDAKLEQLTEAQHEQMLVWLDDENCTYTEVVARVRTEFSLSVGRTAVAGYYQRHVAPLYHDAAAEAAAALIALPEAQFDAAAVKQAKWLAWNALANPLPQVDTAVKLLGLVRRTERQQLSERRLELKARLVAIREQEVAYRASRCLPTIQEEVSVSAGAPAPDSQLKPVVPIAAPEKASQGKEETPSPKSSRTTAPAPKKSQVPPLYSPYFALFPAPAATEIRPFPTHEISPAEIAQVEDILRSAETCPITSDSHQLLAYELV